MFGDVIKSEFVLKVMRYDNLDERLTMPSSPASGDNKRDMFSPELFISDAEFDPSQRYLNTPSTEDLEIGDN